MLGDNQGTIRDAAEWSNGQAFWVEHAVYNAFGEIVDLIGSDSPPTFTYTGREYDTDAELYYYRARWYDANTGQFISEDPLGYAAGDQNLYRYVGNSPTNATDPSGLKKKKRHAPGDGVPEGATILTGPASALPVRPNTVIIVTDRAPDGKGLFWISEANALW